MLARTIDDHFRARERVDLHLTRSKRLVLLGFAAGIGAGLLIAALCYQAGVSAGRAEFIPAHLGSRR